jgi:hypothetical protein
MKLTVYNRDTIEKGPRINGNYLVAYETGRIKISSKLFEYLNYPKGVELAEADQGLLFLRPSDHPAALKVSRIHRKDRHPEQYFTCKPFVDKHLPIKKAVPVLLEPDKIQGTDYYEIKVPAKK